MICADCGIKHGKPKYKYGLEKKDNKMKKYKTTNYGNKIEEVIVIKETKCFVTYVWVNWTGDRIERRESNEGYFNTWQEARGFLQDRAQQKLDGVRRQLQEAQDLYGNIKGMKEPKNEE